MNRYLPFVPLLGIVTTITLQSQPVFALESFEIAAKAKEFTVQIDGEQTGTGTIIERNSNTYTVITCWHVVDAPGEYQIVTPDKETHQVAKIKYLPNIDIAVIEFTSSKTYSVAELGNSETVAPGTDTYVVGYPDPFPGFPEREYLFSSTEVKSRLSKSENGYHIIHDGSFTPGSSGGGIFDSDARLIGVNGQFIWEGNTGKAYGKGIPLEIYLATRPNLSIPANITPPQDFVSVGRRKLKQGDYQGAIAEFDRALASNSNDLDSLLGRAEAYYRLKYFPEAIKNYDEVLKRDPNNAIAYSRRGSSYSVLKEHQKALSDHTQAISLNSNSPIAYTNRGTTYSLLGEYDKAIADHTEAIRLNPEFAIAYNNRGESYNNLGEFNKAIADYTEALRLDPDYANAYYNRGISYGQLGDKQRAIEDFQQAADLFEQQGNIADYQKALDLIRNLQ